MDRVPEDRVPEEEGSTRFVCQQKKCERPSAVGYLNCKDHQNHVVCPVIIFGRNSGILVLFCDDCLFICVIVGCRC